MADVKQPSPAASSIKTLENDGTGTKDATSLTVSATSNTESKSSLWRRVLSFVWDSADGDVEYRRYVRRLDLFLLSVLLLPRSSAVLQCEF